ncbi:NAD-dependent epimerase/dehydratase family protein [Xanthobacter tagetidis]|nr:NAD-dependent epimerase/dehydratase family protein [Xanthobacter tagetidis]MBB6306744.1 nucleoside-diphosphate-sugar epimerase [Xanthobacter tagetidis]
MSMRIFVTGATGYIGGSIAARLVARGHEVVGLTRSAESAARLRETGVTPVVGSLVALGTLAEVASGVDAVINAANSDDPFVVEAILPVLEGTGKSFIHTSGSSIIADRGGGERSDLVFNEDTPFVALPERQGRAAVERLVLSYGQRGVRSVVVRPTLIYGQGAGLHKSSIQVPRMLDLALAKGKALHIGKGENVWSNVHIDDVVDLYLLALEMAPPGSLFFAENGECSMRTIAEAISRLLGHGGRTESWPMEEALKDWGISAQATFASNSRVSAQKARAMLGWNPKGPGLVEDVEHGSYRALLVAEGKLPA